MQNPEPLFLSVSLCPRGRGLEASITDSNEISAILTNAKIVVDSEDENKIQLRVDLTGDQTQKVFDRILTNLGRTAPPVPGFRMQKGDPKGLPCTDAWGRTCHQVLNTRNTQLYHG
ncbi:hypothetical protein HKD37_11G031172 [Glycine soja]